MVRDRSCSSKPHLGGLKLGPCTTSGAQKKSASEASYIDMEVQRPKEGDVQRELYLQSFGGRTDSTILPDSGVISRITI